MRRGWLGKVLGATLVLLLCCVTAGWGPAGHQCVSSHGCPFEGSAEAQLTADVRDDAHAGPCLGCLLSGQLRASALPSPVVVVEARALSPIVDELPAFLPGARRTPRTARAPPLPL